MSADGGLFVLLACMTLFFNDELICLGNASDYDRRLTEITTLRFLL